MAKAQGATEYLVLLGVVLLIALVAIALLGFFPGLSADAQATESKAYWSSAYPLAIVEWDAMGKISTSLTNPYLRIRNVANYPITITAVLGGNNQSINFLTNGVAPVPITNSGVIQPGQEISVYSSLHSGSATNYFTVSLPGTGGLANLAAGKSICSTTGPNFGYLWIDSFGFQYNVTIEKQQISKREVGTIPIMIKCSGAG